MDNFHHTHNKIVSNELMSTNYHQLAGFVLFIDDAGLQKATIEMLTVKKKTGILNINKTRVADKPVKRM